MALLMLSLMLISTALKHWHPTSHFMISPLRFPTKNHCKQNPLTQHWGQQKNELRFIYRPATVKVALAYGPPLARASHHTIKHYRTGNITHIQLRINILPNLHLCPQPFHNSYRRQTFLLHHIYVAPHQPPISNHLLIRDCSTIRTILPHNKRNLQL